jgi:HK97 family phage prohead protease
MILYRSASSPSLRTVPSSGAEGGSETPTLYGYLLRFNQWTEIDSTFEGNFMERLAPGSVARSFAQDRTRMRVLFQHGRDPQLGNRILGNILTLRETEAGGFYEVPLFRGLEQEAPLLMEGLRAGAYGASFRFKVIREDLDQSPSASSYNPKALPERTIREAKVLEFGPVTFPAYQGATAGVRSLTDWYLEAA